MNKNQFLGILIVISFLLSGKSLSAAEYSSQNSTAAAEEFADQFNQIQLYKDTSYKVSTSVVADECLIFLNKNDFLGPLGASISKNFIEHQTLLPELVQGGEVNSYCRNYSTMSVKQKSMVWVMVLAVVAHYESSCKSGARAEGPNGVANGLYQLHLGLEQDYDGGQRACGRNTSSNPQLSSQCALGMLNFQLQKLHGHLFNNKSYWDVLRPNGASHRAFDIQKSLVHSNFCNPKLM